MFNGDFSYMNVSHMTFSYVYNTRINDSILSEKLLYFSILPYVRLTIKIDGYDVINIDFDVIGYSPINP